MQRIRIFTIKMNWIDDIGRWGAWSYATQDQTVFSVVAIWPFRLIRFQQIAFRDAGRGENNVIATRRQCA